MLVWPLTDTGRFKKDHRLSNPMVKQVKEDDLFNFLKKRIDKLSGVVITGGEPTLHFDLPDFLAKIKKMGFKIKLDTNGTNPGMLEKLIRAGLLDYLAMDLKAPLEKYEGITGVKAPLKKIKQSIKIIMKSGLPYEFRTTVVPGLLNKEDIRKIGKLIKDADKWYLQFFKSDTDLVNKRLEGKKACSGKEMREMAEIGRRYVKICEVR